MRQITTKAITIFSTLTSINIFLSTAIFLAFHQVMEGFRPVLYFLTPLFFYLSTILTYRLLFKYLKFPLHQITKSSSEDFASQIYILYYLIYFNFLIHNPLLPIPASRVFHQILGTKFGSGSYSAGIILDPPYVEMGENSIIGFSAILCSHAFESDRVSFEKIIIGNNVTIGLRTMIMPGVRIEDNAIVAAGALVTKNTHIKNGEVWAGIPAKRINFCQKEPIPLLGYFAS